MFQRLLRLRRCVSLDSKTCSMVVFKVQTRAARLLSYSNDDCSLAHWDWCQGWARQSFLFNLVDAERVLEEKMRGSNAMSIGFAQRQGFQRRITPLFKSVVVGSDMVHLRRRSDRWVQLTTLPGHRHFRATAVLEIFRSRDYN